MSRAGGQVVMTSTEAADARWQVRKLVSESLRNRGARVDHAYSEPVAEMLGREASGATADRDGVTYYGEPPVGSNRLPKWEVRLVPSASAPIPSWRML